MVFAVQREGIEREVCLTNSVSWGYLREDWGLGTYAIRILLQNHGIGKALCILIGVPQRRDIICCISDEEDWG